MDTVEFERLKLEALIAYEKYLAALRLCVDDYVLRIIRTDVVASAMYNPQLEARSDANRIELDNAERAFNKARVTFANYILRLPERPTDDLWK